MSGPVRGDFRKASRNVSIDPITLTTIHGCVTSMDVQVRHSPQSMLIHVKGRGDGMNVMSLTVVETVWFVVTFSRETSLYLVSDDD